MSEPAVAPTIKQVACGLYHTAAITATGDLYTWGGNKHGQLGHGDTIELLEPRKVVFKGFSKNERKVKQVVCGVAHTIVLLGRGKTVSFGSGIDGKTGHGTTEGDTLRPIAIPALRVRVVTMIASGPDHCAAVTESGELLTWGVGSYGNLGHGDNKAQASPKIIDQLLGKQVIDVSCGGKHTMALTKNGLIYVFGYGGDGRLGMPSGLGSFVPVCLNTAFPPFANMRFRFVCAGESHSLAITKRGELYTWGAGDYGKLGHGDNITLATPKFIDQFRTTKIAVAAASSFHTLCISEDGDLFSFGGGSYGKLGQGDASNKLVPRKLRTVKMSEVSCSSFHSAAISTSGDLYTWGYGGNGRLGHANTTSTVVPGIVNVLKAKLRIKDCYVVELEDEPTGGQQEKKEMTVKEVIAPKLVDKMAMGSLHTLIGTDNGFTFVWGNGSEGQLGFEFQDEEHKELKQAKVLATLADVVQLRCGTVHSVAVTKAGKLYSWGCGEDGRLGHGDTNNQLLPRKVMTLNALKVVHVSCGENHSAACTENGALWTWGNAQGYKLGHGGLVSEHTPVQVMSLQDIPFALVECGATHTVALSTAGQLWSWGSGWKGRLGHGDQENRKVPTLINSMKRKKIAHVACGSFHTLALSDKGHLYVWGVNSHGQLGVGDRDHRAHPTVIDELRGHRVVDMAAGEAHSLILLADKTVHSFGSGQYGQLGTGTLEDSDMPRKIESLTKENIVLVRCGANHSGAVSFYGTVFVWGNGANSRLGLPSLEVHVKPTKVTSIKTALAQSGHISPALLDELRGTNIDLNTTVNMLGRAKKVAARVKSKQAKGVGDVDMQNEMEAVSSGVEGSQEEQNMATVMAAALASGSIPPQLDLLQQVVKAESLDLEAALKTEIKDIASLKDKLDVICVENNDIEMQTFESEAKINMTIANAHDLQRTLSEANGLKLDDIWTPEGGLELKLNAFSDMLSRIIESPELMLGLVSNAPEREEQEQIMSTIANTLLGRQGLRNNDFVAAMNAYGDRVSPRDEHTMLSMVLLCLNQEASRSTIGASAIRQMLAPDSILSLVLSHYAQRRTCHQALRGILQDALGHILQRENRFELNPVSILMEMRMAGGGKEDDEDITLERAQNDKEVQREMGRRIGALLDIVDRLLNTIMKLASHLPYGLRAICRELYNVARDKMSADEEEFKVASVVNSFMFQRVLCPAVTTPFQLGLVKSPPSVNNAHTLVQVGKILEHCATGKMFPESENVPAINKFIRKQREVMSEYAKTVVDVPSLEHTHRAMRYLMTAEELDPVVVIRVNELFLLHQLVVMRYKDGRLEGDQKAWSRLLLRLGGTQGRLGDEQNVQVNIRVRLANRVIWPETSKGGKKTNQPEDDELFGDVKTDLVMALRDLPLIPVLVSGSLVENLKLVKIRASQDEKYVAAERLNHVIEYVGRMETGKEDVDKHQNEDFIRRCASQVSLLRKQLLVMQGDKRLLTNIREYLTQHARRLQERNDAYRMYLNNTRKTKITAASLKVGKRAKDAGDDQPYNKRDEDKKMAQKQKTDLLLVKNVFSEQVRRVCPPDLREYIEQRPLLTKLALAEEVELNADWKDLFLQEPDLNILIGRAASLESILAKNTELRQLLEAEPHFLKMLEEHSDLRKSEMNDFLLDNLELKEFIDDNDELKDMLDGRAAALEEEKKLRDENMELLLVGPVVDVKFQKLKQDGIVISVALPESILNKVVVQFSSATPGSIDILFRHNNKAHYHTQTSVGDLLDHQKDEKRIIELGKGKFHVEKLLKFFNANLKW